MRQWQYNIKKSLEGLRTGSPGWLWAFGSLALLNFLLLLFFIFIYLNNYNIWRVISSVPQAPRRAVEATITWFKEIPYIPYQFMGDNLPRYDVLISTSNYEEILDSLPQNISQFMQDDNKVKKNAILRYDGNEYEVKVGFRGDGSGHWFWPKKSWRIETKGDNFIDGMEEIDFTVPDQREYIMEDLNNYRARKMGLAAPKTSWGVLYVNGQKQGVYYITEAWGQSLLAHNDLNDGANLYGDKNPPAPMSPFSIYGDFFDIVDKWKLYSANPHEKIELPKDVATSTDLLAAKLPPVADDVSFTDLYQFFKVINADDVYFKKNIWNIVDKDDFYAWYTHSKLSGSYHQYWMTNARMYFDPDIGKFKMMPVDVRIVTDSFPYFFIGTNTLVDRLIKDPQFVTEVEKNLWEHVQDEKNLSDDLNYYDALYKKVRVAFYKDHLDEMTGGFFDEMVETDRQAIISNYQNIKDKIQKVEIKNLISLHLPSAENELSNTVVPASVEIMETSAAPIALTSVRIPADTQTGNLSLYKDSNSNSILDFEDRFIDKFYYSNESKSYGISNLNEIFYPTLEQVDNASLKDVGHLDLVRKVYTVAPTKQRYFIVGSIISPERFKVLTSFQNVISGAVATSTRDIYVDRAIFRGFDEISLSQSDFLKNNPIFFKINGKTVGIRGYNQISKTIIVPKGMTLIFEPGTTLIFETGTSFYSYSKVIAKGTVQEPISFVGAAGVAWGTFGIIDVPETSEFEHVFFDKGGESSINGTYFRGMLASHHSDIIVKYSSFSNTTGDDGLNVKSASSTIISNKFIKNGFDAMDIDWGNYTYIASNRFEANGNDGIDLGGSRGVIIKENLITKSGDKCISVGEETIGPIIFNNVLLGCNIGVQVKDLSTPIIINNVIVGNEKGVDAYEKKGIFGGGNAKVYNSIIWGNKTEVSFDDFSSVTVENSSVEGGFNGIGNINTAPIFTNELEGDFTNYVGDGNIEQIYKNGGNKEVLKNYLGLDLKDAPIGLVNILNNE